MENLKSEFQKVINEKTNNNLELALRCYEPSPWNDKITYEKHYYNGFSGLEGIEAYQSYLEGLYVNYFMSLREQIDKVLFIDIDVLLKFLKTKIDLFNEINDIDCNYCLRQVDYKCFESMIERDEKAVSLSIGAINDYGTMIFFRQMIGVQLYFIERAINELTRIYITYNPLPQSMIITERDIDKDTWDNTLKEENDIIDTFDLARIFNRKEPTIRRWIREGVLNPIDRNRRPQQFRKNDVKKYYLKVKDR